MLIPVIYQNGKQDMVKDYSLAELIESQQIRKFKRRGGWVNLPSEIVRTSKHGVYFGPERRGCLLAKEAS